jgi:hypothetical protein
MHVWLRLPIKADEWAPGEKLEQRSWCAKISEDLKTNSSPLQNGD